MLKHVKTVMANLWFEHGWTCFNIFNKCQLNIRQLRLHASSKVSSHSHNRPWTQSAAAGPPRPPDDQEFNTLQEQGFAASHHGNRKLPFISLCGLSISTGATLSFQVHFSYLFFLVLIPLTSPNFHHVPRSTTGIFIDIGIPLPLPPATRIDRPHIFASEWICHDLPKDHWSLAFIWFPNVVSLCFIIITCLQESRAPILECFGIYVSGWMFVTYFPAMVAPQPLINNWPLSPMTKMIAYLCSLCISKGVMFSRHGRAPSVTKRSTIVNMIIRSHHHLLRKVLPRTEGKESIVGGLVASKWHRSAGHCGLFSFKKCHGNSTG